MIVLSRLYLHPVKSMRALRQSHALVQLSGLAFDRQFMVTELDGTFITARQTSEMVLFTPTMLPDGLHIVAPDGADITVKYQDFLPQLAATEVWGNHFSARIAPDVVNVWLSNYFKRPVQLRWVGEATTRRIAKRPDVPLSFADGYPLLLTNEASLCDLQRRCPASIEMTHFRPNLVVAGSPAWDEDSWRVIRINDVTFDVVKPCGRCILTTVSPERGKKHPNGEPLRTLATFRTAANGEIDFGLNLIARNSGVIRAGDEIEILSRAPAPGYGASDLSTMAESSSTPAEQVTIAWEAQRFSGDNQQIILEQLERQGIRVPYSCRAGLCGKCRIKLVTGAVRPLRQGAVGEDGTILCCSCVPQSDITLSNI